jgi:molybdenum cofactor synthesis domain-containing protein
MGKLTHMETTAHIGVITVSDRASRGEYEDLGGPAIRDYLTEVLASPWSPIYQVVPDDRPLIAQEMRRMSDELNCCLIITTGGTGPAVRDVTPEATADVCEKMMPGFGELMRKVSLGKGTDCHPEPTNSRNSSKMPDREPTRTTQGDQGVPRCCNARNSLLHRSDRRTKAGNS